MGGTGQGAGGLAVHPAPNSQGLPVHVCALVHCFLNSLKCIYPEPTGYAPQTHAGFSGCNVKVMGGLAGNNGVKQIMLRDDAGKPQAQEAQPGLGDPGGARWDVSG